LRRRPSGRSPAGFAPAFAVFAVVFDLVVELLAAAAGRGWMNLTSIWTR
jgi:hypothetical protein